jgi:hypothetical protein
MNTNNTQAPQLPQTAVITGALISMTDFIEKIRDIMNEKAPLKENKALKYFDLVFNYSDFLKTKIELGMFFPFDEKGNPVKEPDVDFDGTNQLYFNRYQLILDKVLFKGFIIENGYIQANRDTLYLNNQDGLDIASKNETYDKNFIWDVGFKTIEDLIPYNIKLTDVAIKRIFG